MHLASLHKFLRATALIFLMLDGGMRHADVINFVKM